MSNDETQGHIPYEVWELILKNNFDSTAPNFRYATIDVTRYATLANLCRVSTYIRDITEPLLYHSFSTRHGIQFQSWAHTVVSNPHLATYVRELDLNFLDSGTPHKSRIDFGYNEFFYNLALRYGFDQGYEELSGQVHSWVPLVMLLKALSHPIRLALRMGTLSQQISSCFDLIHRPKIRELRIDMTAHEYIRKHRQGNPGIGPLSFLRADGLERVHLHGLFASTNRLNGPYPVAFVQTKNENVRWLRLTNSLITRHFLLQCLDAFPRLEGLECHASQIFTASWHPQVSLRTFIKLLMPISNHLRSLSLDLSMKFVTSEETAPIKSFAHFGQLESLCIESMAILTETAVHIPSNDQNTEQIYTEPERDDYFKDYFPVSLCRLRITHVYKNSEKPIMELAENAREWLPNLFELQIDWGCRGSENSPTYRDLESVLIPRDILKNISSERGEHLVTHRIRDLETAKKIHPDLPWLWSTTRIDPRILLLNIEIPGPAQNRIVPLPVEDSMQDLNDLIAEDYIQEQFDMSALRTNIEDSGELSFIDDYIASHCHVRHLPAVWQTIAAHFNGAGVRVKLSQSVASPYCAEIDIEQPFEGWLETQQYQPCVSFDNDTQMAKWLWVPIFQPERPRLLGRAYQ